MAFWPDSVFREPWMVKRGDLRYLTRCGSTTARHPLGDGSLLALLRISRADFARAFVHGGAISQRGAWVELMGGLRFQIASKRPDSTTRHSHAG